MQGLSRDASAEYAEMKDNRTRLRGDQLRSYGGDQDEFEAFLLRRLYYDAEVACLKENIDYLEANQNILTSEMKESAMAAISLLDRLKDLIKETQK